MRKGYVLHPHIMVIYIYIISSPTCIIWVLLPWDVLENNPIVPGAETSNFVDHNNGPLTPAKRNN